MSKKAQKNGRNHKKTGKKRAILPKRPFKTGMPVLKRATWSHCSTIWKLQESTSRNSLKQIPETIFLKTCPKTAH